LGCENSHADGFLEFITKMPEYSDIEVIGLHSEDTEAAKKLNEKFGVPVMASCDEAVGKVDGVIITARHGDKHYEFAKPYLDSCLPMFLDKPITVREDYALELLKTLKEKKIPVTGGSSLRYHYVVGQVKQAHQQQIAGPTVGGAFRAPLYPTSPHAGFFFYAQHLVEMVMEAFGRYPKAVQAFDDAGKNRTVLFHYDGFTVTGLYTNGGNEYYAARFSRNGSQGGYVPTNTKEGAQAEFEDYVNLLRGGEMAMSYEDLFAPVFVMNAIDRSVATGQLQTVVYSEG
jgi:predicted dehydrogenase